MWCVCEVQTVSSSAEVASVVLFSRVLLDYISMIALKLYKASHSALSSTIEPHRWAESLLWRKGGSYEATRLSWGFQFKQIKSKVCLCVCACSVALRGWRRKVCKYEQKVKWTRSLRWRSRDVVPKVAGPIRTWENEQLFSKLENKTSKIWHIHILELLSWLQHLN